MLPRCSQRLRTTSAAFVDGSASALIGPCFRLRELRVANVGHCEHYVFAYGL